VQHRGSHRKGPDHKVAWLESIAGAVRIGNPRQQAVAEHRSRASRPCIRLLIFGICHLEKSPVPAKITLQKRAQPLVVTTCVKTTRSRWCRGTWQAQSKQTDCPPKTDKRGKGVSKAAVCREIDHLPHLISKTSVERASAKQQYVGLDVHKNTIHVAVLDQDGKVLRNTKIDNTDEDVRKAFARIPRSASCQCKVALKVLRRHGRGKRSGSVRGAGAGLWLSGAKRSGKIHDNQLLTTLIRPSPGSLEILGTDTIKNPLSVRSKTASSYSNRATSPRFRSKSPLTSTE